MNRVGIVVVSTILFMCLCMKMRREMYDPGQEIIGNLFDYIDYTEVLDPEYVKNELSKITDGKKTLVIAYNLAKNQQKEELDEFILRMFPPV